MIGNDPELGAIEILVQPPDGSDHRKSLSLRLRVVALGRAELPGNAQNWVSMLLQYCVDGNYEHVHLDLGI